MDLQVHFYEHMLSVVQYQLANDTYQMLSENKLFYISIFLTSFCIIIDPG